MLQFEAEDYLDINDTDLLELQKSISPVNLTVAPGRDLEIRAFLCQQKSKQQPICHLIFHSRTLKRSLIYLVLGSEDASLQLQKGNQYLGGLGFSLEPVKLDVTPAMREVLLRDLPFLQKPENARRLREERPNRIAALEKTIKSLGAAEPNSREGLERKRAVEQLNAERRNDENLQMLRDYLEGELFTAEMELERVQAEVDTLQREKSKLKQELSRAEQALAREQQDRQKAQQQVEASARRQAQLEKEKAAAGAAQEGANAQLAEALKQAARVPFLEKKLLQAEKLADMEQRSKENLHKELKKAETELGSLKERLAETDSRLAGLEKSRQQTGLTESRLEKLQEELAASDAAHKSELAGKKRLEQELAAARKHQAELEKQSRQHEKEFALAEQKAQEDLARVREEVEAVKKALAAERLTLEKTGQELAKAKKNQAEEQKLRAASDAELARLKPELARLTDQLKAAVEDRKTAEKSHSSLEKKLEQAQRKLAAAEQAELELAEQLEQARQELAQERKAKESFAGEVKRLTGRLEKLEVALQSSQQEAASAAENQAELTRLQNAQEKLRLRLEAQIRENAALVEEQAAARDLAVSRPQALKAVAGDPSAEQSSKLLAEATRRANSLQKQLDAAEHQLQQLAAENQQLVADLVAEQQKVQRLEEQPVPVRHPETPVAMPAMVPEKSPGGQAPAPVPRRPAMPGATFCVDWDLAGIPAEIKMVGQAWRSIYNVTLSIEGYPHQYVGALIVLLKGGLKDRLFMVLRLDKENLNLVYRPVKPIASEADVKKGLAEAQKFLRVSGIEVEAVPASQLPNMLESYLVGV